MPFGQLVIGPPGSGKSTYCHGMSQLAKALDRKLVVVNLDPANDNLPYEAGVDVAELIHLEEVMKQLNLGPNGGLVYCMEYLQKNLDWLKDKLEPYEKDNCYFVFDFPGQVELFMMHDVVQQIVAEMVDRWHFRLAAVHLVDAHLCCDPSKYLSGLMVSLSTMLHLELPHINVLSKVDLLEQLGPLDFSIDFYTEVQDLSYLVRAMGDSEFGRRHRKLSKALCEIIGDYGLVSFCPVSVQDAQSMLQALRLADRANGFAFAGQGSSMPYPQAVGTLDIDTTPVDVSGLVGSVHERQGQGGAMSD